MASEAQLGNLLERLCNATGQLAKDTLHVITTPHLVKITSQKTLRTLKTKLNKGRCRQMDRPLPLPFSIPQQKMRLGGNVKPAIAADKTRGPSPVATELSVSSLRP